MFFEMLKKLLLPISNQFRTLPSRNLMTSISNVLKEFHDTPLDFKERKILRNFIIRIKGFKIIFG